MATRVERTGIEACITKVNAAIEQLIEHHLKLRLQ